MHSANRARETVDLLCQETSDYSAGRYLWPPNIPDLNPVDYNIWVIMNIVSTRQKSVAWMNGG